MDYETKDPNYVERRFFAGILKDMENFYAFINAYSEFRRYIGVHGNNLPFFSLYPSCIEPYSFVSILAPYRDPFKKKYVTHAAIPINEFHRHGIYQFCLLS